MYILTMASLQRVHVRGYTYWRIVESRRVNGKPRLFVLAHLGKADDLLVRLQAADTLHIKSLSHGAVAAVLAIAREHAAGLNLASGSLQPTRNPLSPMAWTNWHSKCRFALSRQALVSLANYRSPDAETERMASHTRSQLQRVQDEDAVYWQGWWGRHGSTLDFLGDDVAGESGGGAAVPQAVLVILFLALLGALVHKMPRQMRSTPPRPVPPRAPPRRSRQ